MQRPRDKEISKAISRQQKYVPVTTDTHAWKRSFLLGPCKRVIRSKNSSVGREPSFKLDMNTEAEELPLLEAVTRKREDTAAGKDLT
jgi:hypothetical protein